MLAAGTAAQQLDASFSTASALELYSLNLQQPGYDMELLASIPSDQKLVNTISHFLNHYIYHCLLIVYINLFLID